MMTSQILKSVDFVKTQESKYLENKTFCFPQIKSLIAHQELFYGKNTFAAVVTFKYFEDSDVIVIKKKIKSIFVY